MLSLKVTVVISRYDGDTQKSNLPSVLHVNANDGEGTMTSRRYDGFARDQLARLLEEL